MCNYVNDLQHGSKTTTNFRSLGLTNIGTADCNDRTVESVGLRQLACWVCGFESCQKHRCLSVCCECCVLSGRCLCTSRTECLCVYRGASGPQGTYTLGRLYVECCLSIFRFRTVISVIAMMSTGWLLDQARDVPCIRTVLPTHPAGWLLQYDARQVFLRDFRSSAVL